MKSIIRDDEIPQLTLKEFYEKIENEEFPQHIKLLTPKKDGKSEAFQVLTVLGKGRSGYAFLSLKDKKLVALRMSYEKEALTGKFDSVIEKEGETYKKYFLDILYPSIPIRHLYSGVLRKKIEISFDKTVYVSFWEKADTTLVSKLNEDFEKKFQWFRQLLAGLNFIHSRDRVHCDIKLDNLFLVDNQLKIGDFEFYTKVEDFKQSDIFICGTPGHIAPEMLYDRENITPKMDVFSAGTAFARLFTGEEYRHIELTPEEDQHLSEILKKCKKNDRFGQSYSTEIKESLSYSFFYQRLLKEKLEKDELDPFAGFIYKEILLEMMSLDPAQRPGIREIIAKIENKAPTKEEIQKTIVETAVPTAKSPKWLWFAIGFPVVLAVGLFLYFFIFSESPSPEPSGKNTGERKVTTQKTPGQKTVKKPSREKNQQPPHQKIPNKQTIEKPAPQKTESVERAEPPEITRRGISPVEREKIKEQAKYEAYLEIAKERLRDKEYQRALDMIARAKQIKPEPELLELEQAVRQLMEDQEQGEYKDYYGKARDSYEKGRYEEALKNIEIAREIKRTPQLASLELEIKRKLRERDEEYERGLALVVERINNEDYINAREIIRALKKIKIHDELLKLEKEVEQRLAALTQSREEVENEYIKYLLRAQAYMDNGDYEKAAKEIARAREIKNDPQVERLAERLKELRNQRKQDFEKYCKWARVYFDHANLEEASHYLELAKQIDLTYELWQLEREIEGKIEEKQREEAARKADDEAYFNAIRGGEVWHLQEYIRVYPRGRHVEEATAKLNKMLEHLIPRVSEPRLITKVEPIYPSQAKKEGISGVVWIEAFIDTQGYVTKVEVIAGHRMLRNAALKAVKQWRYEPHLIAGIPKPVRFTVKVVFRI